MDLHLNDAETDLLRKILTSYVSDLRMEIIDTDNHEYKANLKDEQAQLNSLLERLGQ